MVGAINATGMRVQMLQVVMYRCTCLPVFKPCLAFPGLWPNHFEKNNGGNFKIKIRVLEATGKRAGGLRLDLTMENFGWKILWRFF